jgi:hypothetical protein
MAISLLIALLVSGPALPVLAQSQLLPPERGLSSMIPLLGLVSAWMHRNRTYRNANDFEEDEQAEYADKLAVLEQQHQDMKVSPNPNATQEEQEAAYVKNKAALEQEQKLAMDFAESIKGGARHDFNQALKDEIIKTVLATGVVQNLLGDLGQGLRQAQDLVNSALSHLKSNGDIGGQVQQFNNKAQLLKLAAGLIGGDDGDNLNQTAQDIMDKVNGTEKITEETLTGIKQKLDNAQGILLGLQNTDYVPTTSELTSTLALQLVGLGQGNPTTDAILNVLGFKVGSSPESLRQRWEQLQTQGFRVRCRAWNKNWMATLNTLAEQLSVEESPTEEEVACKEVTPDDLTQTGGEVVAEPSATTKQGPASGATGQLGHFQKTDCGVEGLDITNALVDYNTLDPNKGPYLVCHNDVGDGFSITPWSDPVQLIAFFQKKSAVFQGFVDQANQWNSFPGLDPALIQQVTFVRHDSNRYVVTIVGYSNVQKCEEGDGYGEEAIDGRFAVQMEYTLDGDCGPSDPSAYPAMMQELEASALTAIARVEGKPSP